MNANKCENGEDAQTEEYRVEIHEIKIVDVPTPRDFNALGTYLTATEREILINEYTHAAETDAHAQLTESEMSPMTVRQNGLTGTVHEIETDYPTDWHANMETSLARGGRNIEQIVEEWADGFDDDEPEYDEDPDGWIDSFRNELYYQVIETGSYKFRVVEVEN